MKISIFIKVLLLVALSIVSNAKESNQQKEDNIGQSKKTIQYYKSYKKEWDKLPLANKQRILDAYKTGKKQNIGKKQDMGYTMAATRFLENKGMNTAFENKESINKNIHAGYVTYDCGAYGINTMTYLIETTGKRIKDPSKHIQACKKLASDKNLNTAMAFKVYKEGLDRSGNNLTKAWNYYNTGRDTIINDRIWQVKAAIMLLRQELDG